MVHWALSNYIWNGLQYTNTYLNNEENESYDEEVMKLLMDMVIEIFLN